MSPATRFLPLPVTPDSPSLAGWKGQRVRRGPPIDPGAVYLELRAPVSSWRSDAFPMPRLSTFLVLVLLVGTLCATAALAQSVDQAVNGVERRYNGLGSLKMGFEQTVEFAGRRRTSERGTVYLLRPGKMRWDYTDPEGKVAVSDGKIFRMYNPQTNQVRQVQLEAMADLRAPLSFLLGRMRLRRMFRNLRVEDHNGQPTLVGEGRGGQDFYSRVEFSYDPGEFRITAIRIVGRDESVHAYRFEGEETNPSLSAATFEFQAPPGAEVVPLTRGFSDVPLESR